MFAKIAAAVVLAVAIVGASAESHTVNFINRCGRGTPQLLQNGRVLSTGGSFTSNGPFLAAIAYLQTGNCGFNGENCMTVGMTLQNPTTAGSSSSADLSLIPPLAFNVPTRFEYINGCNGVGQTCSAGNCDTAFHVPSDTQIQRACQTDNAGLQITFCP
ncbi:glycopeptide [Dendrothele bispora CBS 962.96]|uniref:Glycopeptide n=1 Tax=Dendrothele bispora (strain CBS 962.96) TaxID=1314807 RepID=A0A4S8M0G9_DENBC|nr:glycopeptide [Dendrothele bispora CBS 962.96]